MKRIDPNFRYIAMIALFFLPCLFLSCGGGKYKTDELFGEIDGYAASMPSTGEKDYQLDLFAKMKSNSKQACIAYCFGDDRSDKNVYFDEATSKVLSQTSYKTVFATKLNSTGDRSNLDEERLRHLVDIYKKENISYEAPDEEFAVEKASALCGDSLFLPESGNAAIELLDAKCSMLSQYKNILFFILKQ